MRQDRTVQASLFDRFAQHEIGGELKKASTWLDEHPTLLGLVAADQGRSGRWRARRDGGLSMSESRSESSDPNHPAATFRLRAFRREMRVRRSRHHPLASGFSVSAALGLWSVQRTA